MTTSPAAAPTEGGTSLLAALQYAVRGWPVFPVHSIRDGACTCQHGKSCTSAGKHPRTGDGVKAATTTIETIARWWRQWPEANIGIATGSVSGLLVLDVDPDHGGDDSLDALVEQYGPLPDTVEVLTGGGGRHLYFDPTGLGQIRNSAGALGRGLDIRSENGYVVAPPSRHISGGYYEWELSSHPDDTALAAPPQWLVDALSTSRPQTVPDGDGGNDTKLAGVPEGTRNNDVFKYACDLLRRDVDLSEMNVLVRQKAAACIPPLPSDEVDRAIKSAIKLVRSTDSLEKKTALDRRFEVHSVAEWFKNPPQPLEPIVSRLILPCDHVVIGGARGAYKSWLMMGIALQLARGEGRVLGRFPVVRPVRVLYVHGELTHDHSTFIRWKRITAGDPVPDTLFETYSRVRVRIVRERETIRNPATGQSVTREYTSAVIDEDFVDFLRQMRPDVVLLDPWAVFYTGQEIDNTQIEAAVSEVSKLTDELGITWIIAHHFSQARQGADAEDWWRGASRFADWASVRITLQPAYDDDGARRQNMTRLEARRFANVRLLLRRQETPPDFGAQFDPASGLWIAWDSPTLKGQRRKGPTVDDVVRQLRDYGGKWVSTNKAGAVLDISHSKATALLHDAERQGLVVSGHGPRGAISWSLKEST